MDFSQEKVDWLSWCGKEITKELLYLEQIFSFALSTVPLHLLKMTRSLEQLMTHYGCIIRNVTCSQGI